MPEILSLEEQIDFCMDHHDVEARARDGEAVCRDCARAYAEQEVAKAVNERDALLRQVDALLRQVDALHTVVKRMGHFDDCGILHSDVPGPQPCTCGHDAVLADPIVQRLYWRSHPMPEHFLEQLARKWRDFCWRTR